MFAMLLLFSRSVQPVPPVPRTAQCPQRALSVDNEYLEIIPDAHSNCPDTGYLEPVKTNPEVRESGVYDQPYERLQQQPVIQEQSYSETKGEVNRACEEC